MIDVLMATYRPDEDWLGAQTASILAQRDVDVNLIVREDTEGEGACANFNALLAMSRGDYTAFSDQDDVWSPDKLAKMMRAMSRMESEVGREMPVLVFCDSYVTDDALRPLPGTFISRMGVDVYRGMRVNRLLMQNFISGNVMLLNAALREKVGTIPSDAIMHDYWVALVAAAFGRIGFVDKPLVWYRQHDANVLSACSRSRTSAEFRYRLDRNVRQARAFLLRYGEECPRCVNAFARFDELGWIGRRFAVLRYGLFKHGFKRNLGLMALA